jgi:hypothetical protein
LEIWNERPKKRWEDNIKMDLELEDVRLSHLAKFSGRLLQTLMNYWVPQKKGICSLSEM